MKAICTVDMKVVDVTHESVVRLVNILILLLSLVESPRINEPLTQELKKAVEMTNL